MASSRVGSRMRARMGFFLRCGRVVGFGDLVEALDHGNEEGEGLAGAGGGGGEDVAAFEGGRDGLGLNGGGDDEFRGSEAGFEVVGDVEVGELNAFGLGQVIGGGGGGGDFGCGRREAVGGLEVKCCRAQVWSFVVEVRWSAGCDAGVLDAPSVCSGSALLSFGTEALLLRGEADVL